LYCVEKARFEQFSGPFTSFTVAVAVVLFGMASGMDAKNFALLSRKLEALNYTDPLEPVSAPLVQKLVDDLVHTTESYRALKLKNAKAGQEVEQWQGKVRKS
jgi:hypothetical protein